MQVCSEFGMSNLSVSLWFDLQVVYAVLLLLVGMRKSVQSVKNLVLLPHQSQSVISWGCGLTLINSI